MAPADEEFRRMMEGVRAGSDEAVRELAERYGPYVLRLVRRRLAARLQSRLDPVDCQQEVWASFFTNRERLAKFHDRRSLLAFLARMTNAKVVDQCRRMTTLKREGELTAQVYSDPFTLLALPGVDPTPSQTAISREQLDRMLAGLGERDRQIVLLRLQGASYEEISRQLDVSARTARRTILELSRRHAS